MNSVQELAKWIEKHLVSLRQDFDEKFVLEYLGDEGKGPYKVKGEDFLDCVRLAQEAMDPQKQVTSYVDRSTACQCPAG